MKWLRTFFFFAIFIHSSFSSNAQSFLDGFGIKGGLNIATIHTGSDVFFDELSPKSFFHLGVYRDFWLDLDWSVRAELLYSAKGAKTAFRFGAGTEEEGWFRSNYLAVPIIAQYGSGNFKFGAGTEISLLLNDQLFIDGEASESLLYDRSVDLGIVGNITYTLLMIDIEVRYVYGLIDFTNNQFTDPNGNTILSNGLNNGVLQVGLGLRIF
ncbi:MAG: PorT family protein [Saprospiraceae bacterium]|nr:PorT family protein [Saprospiraceae bacterium]